MYGGDCAVRNGALKFQRSFVNDAPRRGIRRAKSAKSFEQSLPLPLFPRRTLPLLHPTLSCPAGPGARSREKGDFARCRALRLVQTSHAPAKRVIRCDSKRCAVYHRATQTYLDWCWWKKRCKWDTRDMIAPFATRLRNDGSRSSFLCKRRRGRVRALAFIRCVCVIFTTHAVRAYTHTYTDKFRIHAVFVAAHTMQASHASRPQA